ncbi:MAG: acyltransferase family protein [Candidatus Sulfotelmatobacter sp.]|jgi:peptidoglycan/LPS O-acetylase OafA/YrhL
MKHRPDIDGLRAIAIIPVVLFHAGVLHVAGGFVGVDVFFVISGFLITGILLEDIRKDRFSIAKFYERRARRILPALFAVLSFASLAAYKLLLPNDLHDFGHSLISTLFFFSNITFSKEMGYFDGPAELKPLLHTWSLAVEEQFYIVYPLFLFLVTRFFRKRYAIAIGSVLVVSFAYGVWRVHTQPITSFFLATTRAWELLIGGILAIQGIPKLNHKLIANVLGFLGLGLIAYSVFAFSGATPFPGWHALYPCLGAALVIYSGMDAETLVGRILSTRPMVFVGLISYSLYLWHWVIIVFTKQYLDRPLNGRETMAVILASTLIASVVWRFVENPFRGRGAIGTRAWIFSGATAIAMLFAAFGLTAFLSKGFPARFSGEARRLMNARDDFWGRRDECDGKICHLGAPGTQETFVLWGDSHAGALAPAFEHLALSDDLAGAVAFQSSCAPLLQMKRYDAGGKDCTEFGKSVLDYIDTHHIKNVFLHGRWARYTESTWHEQDLPVLLTPDLRPEENYAVFDKLIRSTLAELRSRNLNVVIIASVPEVGKDVPTTLARIALSGKQTELAPRRDQFMRRQQRAFRVLTSAAHDYGVQIVYPHQTLCSASECSVEKDQWPLYVDDDHLSIHGALDLSPLLEGLLKRESGSPIAVNF